MSIDLREALALHKQGDLDRASLLYEAALAADPSKHIAYHLLGMVELKRGNPARAVELIGRAIALRADIPAYHGGIAEAYWALHQVDQAVASCQEALRLKPEDWLIRCNLGIFHIILGQLDAAVALFREQIRLKPDFFEAHNLLGEALELQGESVAALESFKAAVRLDPTSADARGNLGKNLLDRGASREALYECLEARRLQPNSPDILVKLGNVFQFVGRLDEAEACFRRAIQLRPDHSGAYASLGVVQESLGDSEESLTSFRESVRLEPRQASVLARLATRFKDQLAEADEAAIERLLASTTLVRDQRLSLLYGLAQVCDARGEFDRAAELSIEANARQNVEFVQRGLGHDSKARENDVEQLINEFKPEFFERVKGWGLPTERPVFVVGMPRSGTSLVEQILASHSRVFGAGELRLASQSFKDLTEGTFQGQSLRDCLVHLDQAGLERLARSHLNGLEAFNRSSDRIIDKMPENTLFLGLMAALFPNARVIHCRRDPRDTALSCWMTHFGQLRWSCDPEFIAARSVESARIMDHWRNVLPIPIFDIDYEDLVDNLEARSRSLVAACGLDWEPACLDFHKTRRHVRTASVRQVRQPIYRNSIGRWKNYERSLAFLFEKLPPQESTSDSRNHGL
jgi:tetratricopeptide (TPR) repeat protein